jgi:hypothetical protein
MSPARQSYRFPIIAHPSESPRPSRTIDFQSLSFHKLTNPFSSNSFVFSSIQIAGGVALGRLSGTSRGKPTMKPQFALALFRINTCKSVSKQRTLTIFRMNTYAKTRGGGRTGQTQYWMNGKKGLRLELNPPEPLLHACEQTLSWLPSSLTWRDWFGSLRLLGRTWWRRES